MYETIYSQDAACQDLIIVVVPETAWVIKDAKGNEIANVEPPAQIEIMRATLTGDASIGRVLNLDLNSAHQEIKLLKNALQQIINYTNSGTFIGNLLDCQKIAQDALNK